MVADIVNDTERTTKLSIVPIVSQYRRRIQQPQWTSHPTDLGVLTEHRPTGHVHKQVLTKLLICTAPNITMYT